MGIAGAAIIFRPRRFFGCIPLQSTDIHRFDAQQFSGLCEKLALLDEGLAHAYSRYGEPPMWSRPPGFETLVQIILEQQVSLSSAAACFKRLRQSIGAISAAPLLRMSDEEFRMAAVSRQKAAYLRALSTAVASGELRIETLPTLSDEAVIGTLSAIKGIGRWTSDVYLMMVLHRSDRFPLGDVALLQSMREQLYEGEKVPVEELAIRAEGWRPYRTVAAFMLWHAYLQKRGRTYSTIVT